MSNPLSSISKYLTPIWKSDPPKTGHTFSEQKDTCQLATQLVTANLNQMISDRLPGCTLCKATLRETREGKLSLHLGTGELFHFSDEKTMHNWLGDKQMVDILEIQDQRIGHSGTFFLLQRENRWGYDTFESKTKLFDQLKEDYGVLWKLRDLGNNLTSYIHFKTGIFGSQYVDVEHQNLATLANTLKLDDFNAPAPTRQSDHTSWGKGIAACVLGGLLASAGKSLIQDSNQNPVSDAIATLGPAAFKATFAFQVAALNGLDTLPGALLAGIMFLPESVSGQYCFPQLVGSYDTPGDALGVAIVDPYAYVADGYSGLQIIDVNNVSNPTLVGHYNTSGIAIGVAISGNYAYVADYDSGLQIIDVSNVSNPTLAGFYDTPGSTYTVVVSGDFAYIADGWSSFLVIAVSNVVTPSIAGSINVGFAENVAISGNYAYKVGNSDFRIIDVSDVVNPAFVGFYDTPGQAYGVTVSGNYAFVADGGSGLQIIDISNVTSPILAGFYDTPGIGESNDVVVFGSYAYLTDGLSGFQIIDISNITNPTRVGLYDTPGFAQGVAISGNYAYVADGLSGLQIIYVPCLESTSSSSSSSTSTTDLASTTTSSPYSTSFNTEHSTSKSTTMEDGSTSGLDLTPFLWAGLLGGGALCICLIGGTVCILQKRRKSLNKSENLIERGSKAHSSFELDPVVERGHKKIGGEYFQLSSIVKKEAEEIYENTGHVIAFPEGKKKFKYVIGKGNFGAIKVAQRIEDGEYVASKKVKGEANMIASEEEAHMQQDASGDNVLPIYNTIKLEEALYHFMPLAGYGNGSDIQNHLSALNNPKLAIEIIKFVAKDLLTGLKTMHDKEIYHLDIKPDNVVFTNDGKGYIIDFGCAKKVEGKQIVVTAGGKTFQEYVPNTLISYRSIGDNRYFSPERLQACKEKTTFDAEKADTWAAGMMILQMVKNLSPLQVFELPDNFGERVLLCTQDYCLEKLNRFEELQKPEEREIWWVIKGLLDPNVEKRLTAERALQAPCFKGLKKETQAHVFEDLRAEKLIRTAGISRAELNLKNYQHISQIVEKEEKEVYNTEEHHKYYETPEIKYQFTPADGDFHN